MNVTAGDFVIINTEELCRLGYSDEVIETDKYALFLIEDINEESAVIAVPFFYNLEYDYVLGESLCISIDEFENMDYQNCTSIIPTKKIKKWNEDIKSKTHKYALSFFKICLCVFLAIAILITAIFKSISYGACSFLILLVTYSIFGKEAGSKFVLYNTKKDIEERRLMVRNFNEFKEKMKFSMLVTDNYDAEIEAHLKK